MLASAVAVLAANGCRSRTHPPADVAPAAPRAVPAPRPLHAPAPDDRRPAAPAPEREPPVAPAPHARAATATVAVIAAPRAAHTDMAVFERLLNTAATLAPHTLVVLGDAPATVRMRAAERGVLWSPDPATPLPAHRELVANPVHLHLVMMPAAAFAAPETADAAAWLETALPDIDAEHAVCVLLDRPVWQRPALPGWARFDAALRRLGCRSVVVAPDTQRFSWWRESGRDWVTVAPPGSERRDGAPAIDGALPGVLWIHAARAEIRLAVVQPDALLPMATFARETQQQRDRIRHSLAATPVDVITRTTTVTCANPTAEELRMRAHWLFARTDVTVEPQILGFKLAPGDVFRQQFRFVINGEFQLKFTMPVIEMTTATTAADGRSVPLVMRAAPHCPMRGHVAVLPRRPAVDALDAVWPVAPYPLNHVSQVRAGREQWLGPDDCAGRFYVGRWNDWLCLGMHVNDDDIRTDSDGDSVVFCLDTRPARDREAANGAFAEEQGLLRIEIAPTGRSRVTRDGVRRENGRVEAQLRGGSYTVLASIPAAEIEALADGTPLRIDAAVTDRDADGRSRLCFSGDPADQASSRLFAVFEPGDDTQ